MSGKNFTEVVELIAKEDSRFEKGAYFFVRKALDHTLKHVKGEKPGTDRPANHVSGAELLEGIRQFALEQFGPMTITVFQHWGIVRCSDFGDVVFNLVDYGVFGKTEHDNREDFNDGYDFLDVFEKPFLPERAQETSG